MGQCFSCRKSKARIRDKGTKICEQIQSAVSPLHVLHEEATTVQVNGHLPLPRCCSSASASATGSSCLSRRHSSTRVTFSPNMNIKNPLRELVSKRRNRYKEDGFDLDLTYITEKIIAMGYPASNIEGVYRNHIDDVVKFLDSKHKDHYYIYNLCSERCYDITKFHNRVRTFPFDDHNPPKLELIEPFCTDVHSWLTAHPANVAVVHCKAGKGRTGTMICCYLLHSKRFSAAEDALSFYGQQRTQDRKGVTIPSQLRYVNYYSKIVKEQLIYKPVSVYIREIILEPPPCFQGGQGVLCFSISQQTLTEDNKPKCVKLYKSQNYEVRKESGSLVITLNFCLPLSGDIKMEFFQRSKLRKLLQFRFWFNTFFLDEVNKPVVPDNRTNNDCGNSDDNNSEEKIMFLKFEKNDLDIVCKKDKEHKAYKSDFKITVTFYTIPTNKQGARGWTREAPSVVSNENPSESSEAEESSDEETNEEDDWDSVLEGEPLDPRGVGYRLLSECELSSQLTTTSASSSSGGQQQQQQQTELLAT